LGEEKAQREKNRWERKRNAVFAAGEKNTEKMFQSYEKGSHNLVTGGRGFHDGFATRTGRRPQTTNCRIREGAQTVSLSRLLVKTGIATFQANRNARGVEKSTKKKSWGSSWAAKRRARREDRSLPARQLAGKMKGAEKGVSGRNVKCAGFLHGEKRPRWANTQCLGKGCQDRFCAKGVGKEINKRQCGGGPERGRGAKKNQNTQSGSESKGFTKGKKKISLKEQGVIELVAGRKKNLKKRKYKDDPEGTKREETNKHNHGGEWKKQKKAFHKGIEGQKMDKSCCVVPRQARSKKPLLIKEKIRKTKTNEVGRRI